jgi:hypothetical protein
MNLSALRFKIQGQISKINYWLPNLEGSAALIISLMQSLATGGSFSIGTAETFDHSRRNIPDDSCHVLAGFLISDHTVSLV